ncbi:MAG: ABC transporter ATP-binding protein [Planctomycetota bacterium]|nr:ABC transporter ATP-binding protein [Planctomycetota bacterium]
MNRTFQLGELAIEVLRGISLEILTGEFLAILGPSGSGKTTLLNLIGGMDRPTSGSVTFDGLELSSADNRMLTEYRRNQIGFIFQFFNLVPNLTAIENVAVATEICDHPRDADEELARVELTDRRDHFPAQLSGGEQQRVAIARAIAKDPKLLLCDEPTGSLDLETGRRVLRLLVDLTRDLNKTVVVITHNTAIADVADRVVHLGSGRIREIITNASPRVPEEVSW